MKTNPTNTSVLAPHLVNYIRDLVWWTPDLRISRRHLCCVTLVGAVENISTVQCGINSHYRREPWHLKTAETRLVVLQLDQVNNKEMSRLRITVPFGGDPPVTSCDVTVIDSNQMYPTLVQANTLQWRHNGRLKSPASRLFTQQFIQA